MPLIMILSPVFIQVALTFALMFWMGALRRRALINREVRLGDIALGEPAWPKFVTQVANAFHNQLETPMLLYAVVALSLSSVKPDALFVALEWLFVAGRLAHAYVYCTSNDVRLRGPVFGVGFLALIALWFEFFVRVALA